MAKKYAGLKEYLNEEYFNLLSDAAAGYVNAHKYTFKTEYIPFFQDDPEVESCAISSLYTEALTGDYVYIHCSVSVSVLISGFAYGKRHNDVDTDTIPLWLSIKLKAKFTDKFEDMRVVDVRLLEDRESFKMRAASTKNFVPYIQEQDLEYHAEQFLGKYYPEALKTPTPISMRELTKRMGLKVLMGNLKGGAFGKCYFRDHRIKGKDGNTVTIERGTILCDKTAFFFNGIGNTNNTIVHEAVHWDLHNKFFALMHLLDESLSNISCTVLGEDIPPISPSLQEEYKWMEWQANALAPRILMPAKMTKLKFEQIAGEEANSGETNLAVIYERTINRLATFFGVTVTSVKIRLLELGYDHLKGIHDFVDNHPTKSYLYNAKEIKPEQSFSAGFYDAVANGTINLQLREHLEKGTIVYAGGFFVINSKKYTYRDKETGRQELTDYALEHMDECCLVFDHERKNKNSFNDKYYSMCFLARSRNNEFSSNIDSGDEHNSAVMARATEMADLSDELSEIQEANRLVRMMNGTFGEALQMLMKENGFSNASLYKASGINDHKIADFIAGRDEPSKKEAVVICAVLELYPQVAHKLLETASIRLSPVSEQDCAYEFLIQTRHWAGLDAWNEQLHDADRSDWVLP